MVWTLWLDRNNILFNEASHDMDKVLDDARFKAWCRCKAKVKGFDFSLYVWRLDPMNCLLQM